MSAGTFENAAESLGAVSAELFARILGQVADLALVVDGRDAVVRDVAYGPTDLRSVGLSRLVGRPLATLVTPESRGKVEALLTGASAPGRWRHVNFPAATGDVPVSLQAFGLGGGRLLVVGRDERETAATQRRFISAQRELEQAHARVRQADLRFQTMLALSGLAVLTLDGDTLAVLEVNPVAQARLADGPAPSPGQSLLASVVREDADAVRDALVSARASGRSTRFAARLRGGRHHEFEVAAFRFEQVSRLVLRVCEAGEGANDGAEAELLFSRLPHAVAVTAPDLRVLRVNRAFADLVELSTEANAVGQPLERFIGRNGVDTAILAASLRDQELVRNFATVASGVFGAVADVELDAVRLDAHGLDAIGFFIRAGGGGRQARPLDARDRAGLAEQVTDVVGRVALKDIVRDTTNVIERLCIETALSMTDDNRAAAAEMLGISRQSLYAKLSRYGLIGDLDPGEDGVQQD